jgi:cephalosporin hydroxylase
MSAAVPSCWFNFHAVYDLAVREAPRGAVLVELGSLWGKSALYLAERAKAANKDLEVYCIDNFSEDFLAGSMEGQEQARHGSQFETFAHYVSRSGLCPDPLRVIYAKDTLEAADLFRTRRPWFVFFDSDHSYEYLIKELEAWVPLIRWGGVAAGHDYHDEDEEFPGVVRAVWECFPVTLIEKHPEHCWLVRIPAKWRRQPR